jgi:hypothetical protein
MEETPMSAISRFFSNARPAPQQNAWDGEDSADPLAKGPGFGNRIPSDGEFDRRFPPELAKAPEKEPTT